MGASKPTPEGVKAIQRIGRRETTDRCPKCGEPVTYITRDGSLVALDVMCRRPHRHQPKPTSPEENRRRVAALQRREKGCR